MGVTVGRGSLDSSLELAEIRQICSDALSPLDLSGRRVLMLIPDQTRHAPLDLFFSIMYDLIGREVRALDCLVATGTHRAMEESAISRHLGIPPFDHASAYPNVHLYNHQHDNPAALATIGMIPAREIRSMTGGLFDEDIPVTINSRVLQYDRILIISPVVPHEAMGFAGGYKYFFPGVGGIDIIQTFHWLAAIITNPVVNGVKDTPTRRLVNRAAGFVTVPATCFAFAVRGHRELSCLFAGDPEEAWSRAADYSARIHIRTLDRPRRRILGITPAIYEEIWVGGKAMYKLEPVVADDGELIIYGPQIRELSFVHGAKIRQIGYHVRDYFVRQWDRFRDEPKLVLAHSTNVRGVGTYDGGVEQPRIGVTLATAIPADLCHAVNLGYRDPRSIDIERWRRQQDDDTLVVEDAGQELYRLTR